MELTTGKEGEKLIRHEICENDIWVVDRIYGTISGIEHVLASIGDFVLRFKSKAFVLYDENGERVELLPELRKLSHLGSTDVECYYKVNGQLKSIRRDDGTERVHRFDDITRLHERASIRALPCSLAGGNDVLSLEIAVWLWRYSEQRIGNGKSVVLWETIFGGTVRKDNEDGIFLTEVLC